MKNKIKRSPGRPRTFDRAEALEAALLLFWRNGYEGTSIAQLTEALGITPPSLYAAFGSKDQLYREVLDLYLSTHGDFIAKALTEQGLSRNAIERMLKEAAKRFTQAEAPHGCLVASGVLRCAGENQSAARHTAARRLLAQDAIRRRIDQAVEEGELPAKTDTAGLAAFYASTIQGMSVQAVDGASRAQLNEIGRFAMAVWPAQAS